MNYIYSICEDNCLKCTNNVCVFCDIISGYRLVANKCVEHELDNCDYFNNYGDCLHCSDGYQLDLNDKCVENISNDEIPNCAVFSTDTACTECNQGFALTNLICEKIEEPIPNCERENSQAICERCQPNFILSEDKLICIDNPNNDNCLSYTVVECDQCSQNYIKEDNAYLYKIFSNLNNIPQQEEFITDLIEQDEGHIDIQKFNVCLEQNIPNCVEYKTFNRCARCDEGFFVDVERNGYCSINPIDSLYKCIEYKSLTECIKCDEEFLADENFKCQRVKPFKHCLYHKKDDGREKCGECEDNFFLLGDKCVERKKNNIPNCNKYIREGEGCHECLHGYKPTHDRMNCFEEIVGCLKFRKIDDDDVVVNQEDFKNETELAFICTECIDGYFYNEENFCQEGSVENCRMFMRDEDKCARCDDKYYLSDGFCHLHDATPNCEKYNTKIPGVCMECNYSTFHFGKKVECVATDPIENCKDFRDEQNCFSCEDGYYLDSDTCKPIPPSENCNQRNKDGKCDRCFNNFILFEGVCKDPIDYFLNECEEHNVNGVIGYDHIECYFCKENSIPIEYRDSYMCIEEDIYENLIRESLDPDCLSYDNFKCTRCNYPKVVDDGVCVDECSEEATLYKQILENHNTNGDRKHESFSIEMVNHCGPGIAGCLVAAPNVHQPNDNGIKYACIQCKPDFYPEIRFEEGNVLINNPFIEGEHLGTSPVSKNPVIICQPFDEDTKMLGEVDGPNLVENCEYFLNLGQTVGCTKCFHGFTGVVVDIVYQCDKYLDPTTCERCNQGYYLKSPFECARVEEITNCIEYDTEADETVCLNCNDEAYLDDGCDPRELSLNVDNCSMTPDADECECYKDYINVAAGPGFNCQPLPAFCKSATTEDNELTCVECDNKNAYMNEITGNCDEGSIDYCSKYSPSEHTCVDCRHTYYAKGGV